ncbi:DUF4203 domain-containing protein [Plasmodiophora brassicae]
MTAKRADVDALGASLLPAVQNVGVCLSGAVLGACVSFIANCTLVEISLNPFFGFYFGMLFLFIGGVVFWRVKTLSHARSVLLLAFSSLVILSGLICFVLDTPIVQRFGWLSKVPLFCILGVSVVFALLFAILDLINFFVSTCQTETSPGLIENTAQVNLILATSVIMGVVFGFVFGMLDVEDAHLANLRLAFMRDQSICYPIGAVLGGVAALINQRLAAQDVKYAFSALNTEETFDNDFDEDL